MTHTSVKILDLNQEYSSDDSEKAVVVKQSRENVLKLFANSNSKWSEYYNITMVAQEHAERQKNAPPLLSADLKQKLQQRRLARKSGGASTASIQTNTSQSISEQSIVRPIESTHEPSSPLKKTNSEKSHPISSTNDKETFITINETQNEENITSTGRYISRIPWQTKKYDGHSGISLHEEIIDFYNFIKETPEERQQREELLDRITTICKSVDTNCKVSVFGSYPAQLMLPGSDLDIYVESKRFYGNALGYLRNLATAIRSSRIASKIEFVQAARVPLVKFVDKKTGQHVDISCNIQGPTGENAITIIEKFSAQFPAFKYLTLLLKYFLRQRALNEVFTGGISSYGLCLMVISHLQMHISNVSEKDMRTTSLGTLLLDFFALYGIYFNYKRIGLDVTNGGSYVAINKELDTPVGNYKGPEGTKLFTIDPNDPYNNVTKSCWNMSAVRNAFRYAFSALTAYGEENTDGSFLSSIIRVSQDLIERRIWVHGDEQYRTFCSRNFIPYGLTDQKKEFNKFKSKDKKDDKRKKKRKERKQKRKREDSSSDSEEERESPKKKLRRTKS
jgi:non-canonical poly(A) RNA polymerase PAPD5/7